MCLGLYRHSWTSLPTPFTSAQQLSERTVLSSCKHRDSIKPTSWTLQVTMAKQPECLTLPLSHLVNGSSRSCTSLLCAEKGVKLVLSAVVRTNEYESMEQMPGDDDGSCAGQQVFTRAFHLALSSSKSSPHLPILPRFFRIHFNPLAPEFSFKF
jgi:hypothetical protein